MLQRSENVPQLDLNNIISGLHGLGRLSKSGGMRPVIVVVNNALDYLPEGSELALDLQEVRGLLEEHYGGDLQPGLTNCHDSKATFEALVFGLSGIPGVASHLSGSARYLAQHRSVDGFSCV